MQWKRKYCAMYLYYYIENDDWVQSSSHTHTQLKGHTHTAIISPNYFFCLLSFFAFFMTFSCVISNLID